MVLDVMISFVVLLLFVRLVILRRLCSLMYLLVSVKFRLGMMRKVCDVWEEMFCIIWYCGLVCECGWLLVDVKDCE